jgi:hypothetical protein
VRKKNAGIYNKILLITAEFSRRRSKFAANTNDFEADCACG